MAEWKKVLVSGSNIEVNQITGSGDADIQGTLSLPDISDVSASLAAAIAGTATAGDGIFVNGNIVSVDSGSLAPDMAGGFITATNGTLNLADSVGTLGTTEFTGSYTGSFTGDGSGLTELKATESDLVQQILTNQSVGGISSGTTFNAGTSVEDLLRQILISFIQSTIGTPTLRNNGSNVSSTVVREVNTSITADQFSITTTENDPDGFAPTNLSLTGSGATSGNFENDYSGTTLVDGTNTITISPDEVLNISSIATANEANITITARAKDPTSSAILTKSRNYKYVYPFYYGASTTDLSSATGTALETAGLTKLVEAKGTKQLTMAATSQYLYFAYPSRYGDLADIKDANNSSQLANNYTKYTVTINGGNGWSNVGYNVYQSNGTTSITSQTYTISF